MIRMEYPSPDFRTRTHDSGRPEIFDEIRRRWVRLSPEEWVRQNLIRWMIIVGQYPGTMMAVEKEIKLGSLRKKFDILVYDRNHRPWLMVECKAMDIPLTKDVLMQVLSYNMAVPVVHMVITNGNECHIVSREQGHVTWLDKWPVYI
ncbi:MAG: type I restriction enzyme HsdR N-terminal domain-containing protein [Chitinophagaceae bacterium]|nr:type I restriction enzyme HsdR N-terminal domain-containing protein [Chitinophagaceae bacterium]